MKITSHKRMLKWLALAPLLAATQLHAGLIGSGFMSMSQAFPGKGMTKKEAEILVKFKAGVSEATKDAKHAAEGNEVVRSREVKRFGLQTVRISPAQPIEQAVANYKADPNVEFAEPNFEIKVMALPNDPTFNQQWGLKNLGVGGKEGADVKAELAWNRGTGSTDVVVLVIDTGIWWTSKPDALGQVATRRHQDLEGNVWVNPGETSTPGFENDGIDNDNNGCIDDIHGCDMVNNDGDPLDDNGHGSHVAGILGAKGNNSLGLAGVNWNVKIAACKALGADGKGTMDNAVRCLAYARALKDNGVNVVVTNNSYGGLSTDPDVTPVRIAAMNDAIANQLDILFVAAAGNTAIENGGGQNNDVVDFFPADYALPNVIAVAATNQSDDMANFSHYGRRSVHVGAPGYQIYSIREGQGNNYYTADGTSQAAPFVSGLAALIKSQNPTMAPSTIKNLILAGGDPLPSLEGKTITGRRMNMDTSTLCSGKTLFTALKVAPAITVGVANTLSAISINCGTPVGPVTATTSNGQQFLLLDDGPGPDGTGPDQLANDGEFTATWTPTQGFAFIDLVSLAGTERLTTVDLIATAASVPPSANLGDTVPVTITISNPATSKSAVPASSANVYLSQDALIDGADTLLGTVQIPGIPSGQDRTVIANLLIPTTLPAGIYFIGVVADPANQVVEALESNNLVVGNAITVNAATADLTVIASTAPTTAVRGNLITVTGTVLNSGTGAAGASTLGFYLSTDAVLSPNDTLVGSAPINPLAAAAQQLASGNVTVPASLPAATYFLIVAADTANTVLESNEGNNTRAVNTIAVTTPARDLTLTAVGNPSTSRNSPAINLTATLRNTGTVAAPIGTKVRWYLSTDATITTTDLLLGEAVTTATLNGGSTRSMSKSVRIPVDVVAASYYIGAIADPENLVSENNETNNARASTTRIAVSYTVDLTMTAVNASSFNVATGQNVTFTGSVRNAGAAAAGSTVVNFYLSSDSSISTSDRLIGSATLASVAAGATVAVPATTVALRTDLPAGLYYVGAIVDPGNLVAESNNNNNTLALTTSRMTTTYGPDLVVTAVNGPTIGTRGTAIAVTGTVLNQGLGAVGAATDRRVIESGSTVSVGIYLSTNPTITAFDTLIGSATFSSLAAGASLPINVNVTIPAGMTVGNYYIGAIADRASAVREASELNNALPGNLISVR